MTRNRLALGAFVAAASPGDLQIVRGEGVWLARCAAGQLVNEDGSVGFTHLQALLSLLAGVGIRRCDIEWDGLAAVTSERRDEAEPVWSYAEMAGEIEQAMNMLLSMAQQTTDLDALAGHLTQCTALLSFLGVLAAPHGYASYDRDHKRLAEKIVVLAKRLARH